MNPEQLFSYRQTEKRMVSICLIGMEVMSMNDILIALEIMWKGMAGIFAAVLIIMAVVYIMGKSGKK